MGGPRVMNKRRLKKAYRRVKKYWNYEKRRADLLHLKVLALCEEVLDLTKRNRTLTKRNRPAYREPDFTLDCCDDPCDDGTGQCGSCGFGTK